VHRHTVGSTPDLIHPKLSKPYSQSIHLVTGKPIKQLLQKNECISINIFLDHLNFVCIFTCTNS